MNHENIYGCLWLISLIFFLVAIWPKPSEEVREWTGDAFLIYISIVYSVALLAQLKQLCGGKIYLSPSVKEYGPSWQERH